MTHFFSSYMDTQPRVPACFPDQFYVHFQGVIFRQLVQGNHAWYIALGKGAHAALDAASVCIMTTQRGGVFSPFVSMKKRVTLHAGRHAPRPHPKPAGAVRSALAGKLFSNEAARLFVWWYPLPRLCVKEGASEPQRREARHSFCEKGYVRDSGT